LGFGLVLQMDPEQNRKVLADHTESNFRSQLANEDTDFLYADLDDKNRGVDYERLLVTLTKLEKENSSLKKELDDSKSQIVFLLEQKDTLEKNMAVLFNTATSDAKRKDRQIIELTMNQKR